jgi:hypothetical protein
MSTLPPIRLLKLISTLLLLYHSIDSAPPTLLPYPRYIARDISRETQNLGKLKRVAYVWNSKPSPHPVHVRLTGYQGKCYRTRRGSGRCFEVHGRRCRTSDDGLLLLSIRTYVVWRRTVTLRTLCMHAAYTVGSGKSRSKWFSHTNYYYFNTYKLNST